MLTYAYVGKQTIIIIWSAIYVFSNKSSIEKTATVGEDDVSHKHYLAYYFIKLTLFYLLTAVLGHFFRQWRKGIFKKKVLFTAETQLLSGRGDENLEFATSKDMTAWLGDSSFYSYTFISLLHPVQQELDLAKLKNDYFYKCSMVFFIQFCMTLVLVKFELFDSSDETGLVQKPTIESMYMRLFTAYLFHMMNYTDLDGAYRRLKFLRYNPDKFDADCYWCAFMSTQYQFIVTFICESTALLYIVR